MKKFVLYRQKKNKETIVGIFDTYSNAQTAIDHAISVLNKNVYIIKEEKV